MKRDPLAEARRICLSLPGATEKTAWGAPTFRVKERLFAMYADNHHGDGRIALWVKAPAGEQDVLVAADPDRFFVPPYVGPSGWVGVRLDRGVPWADVTEIVEAGYRMAAPKERRVPDAARATSGATRAKRATRRTTAKPERKRRE